MKHIRTQSKHACSEPRVHGSLSLVCLHCPLFLHSTELDRPCCSGPCGGQADLAVVPPSTASRGCQLQAPWAVQAPVSRCRLQHGLHPCSCWAAADHPAGRAAAGQTVAAGSWHPCQSSRPQAAADGVPADDVHTLACLVLLLTTWQQKSVAYQTLAAGCFVGRAGGTEPGNSRCFC